MILESDRDIAATPTATARLTRVAPGCTVEICDGADNDCDGTTDDGC